MRKFLLFIIVLIILLAGGVFLFTSRNEEGGFLYFDFSKNSKKQQQQVKHESKEPVFINQGPAPALVDLTKWFNSEPQTLAGLQGKVVLLNFWTYSCINCIHSLPYLNKWHDQYKDQGLTILGIHTPEFNFEKLPSNVEAAIKRYKVNYPVALDSNYKTWLAYNNQFWPAIYLIDKNGEIVYTHFGDGNYQQTEKAIRLLLGLEGEFTSPEISEHNKNITPPIYLGIVRSKNFGGSETISRQEQIFIFPKELKPDHFAFEGKWQFKEEAARHTTDFGRIRLNFNASKVFMVAQSVEPVTIKIYVDGQLQKGVTISSSDLYSLYESTEVKNRTMEVEFPRGDVDVYAFTFE
jgi:thiol-disulfide isomerase/thioredoxin